MADGSGDGQGKTYSQAELDAVILARVDAATAAAQAKMEAALAAVKAPFDGVDVEEYKRLKEAETRRSDDALLAKGQFDQLLNNTVKEKDAALQKIQKEAADQLKELTAQLERSEVDGKLLAAARKAHRPDQVAALLRGSIRFDPKKGVMVVDSSGNPVARNGKPLTIDEHVSDFLEANPHFLPATPGGAGSQGSVDGGSSGAAAGSGDPVADVVEGIFELLPGHDAAAGPVPGRVGHLAQAIKAIVPVTAVGERVLRPLVGGIVQVGEGIRQRLVG